MSASAALKASCRDSFNSFQLGRLLLSLTERARSSIKLLSGVKSNPCAWAKAFKSFRVKAIASVFMASESLLSLANSTLICTLTRPR